MKRDGQTCTMCGTKIFDWQTNEYDVIGLLCPECTMEVRDYGEFEDMSDEQVMKMIRSVF